MKKKKLILVGVGVVVLIASCFGAVCFCSWVLSHADSHRTNRQYILWKKGEATYDPAVALRYIIVDPQFRHSLRGKTREEVRKWFPDLRPPEKGNDHQRSYNQDVEDMDFLWIGDSTWGIEFYRGRVKKLHLFKG